MKGQRRALELQEGGGCSAASAASAQHVHAARRAVSALQTRLLLAKCFQILTSSEAASALAVAVSAKPLQHQVSCFRLSKLLWLVLTLFRLLTLKLRYILSQFWYIAGRDGLLAKIGIGWGGLKRQGKDFVFLVESTNGLNLRDDYPQILGDSTKALIWRQSWLLNMCVFCPLVRSIKKNSTDLESTGGNVLSLGASGLSLNLLRGGRQGDETGILLLLSMSFSKAFVPLLSSP